MNSNTDKIKSLDKIEYFHFSQISQYIKKYTPEQFVRFFTSGENKIIDKDLEILVFDNGYYLERICVGKNIPSFTLYWIDLDKHKGITWEILENFIYPVYYDAEREETSIGYNDNLWLMRFVEDYENLKTFAISNRTDFNEKFGWYPHLKIEKEYIPLNFTGELLINNRKAYLFLDLNYESEFFETHSMNNNFLEDKNISFDDLYCLVFEDDSKLNNLFVKHQLSRFDEKLISSSIIMDTEKDNNDKRYIPVDPVFNFAPLVQDYYGPEIEKLISGEWKFLYQIPVPWYGAEQVKNTKYYKIDEGDYGSIAIFMNTNNEFRVEYNQT